jgi:hypothetical protein
MSHFATPSQWDKLCKPPDFNGTGLHSTPPARGQAHPSAGRSAIGCRSLKQAAVGVCRAMIRPVVSVSNVLVMGT